MRKWTMLVAAPTLLGVCVASAAPKKTPELLEQGKATYASTCVSCHGENGDGNGVLAPALVPKPRNFATEPFKLGNTPDEVFKSISLGSPGTAMPGYSSMSEEARWALTYYVLSLRKPAETEKAPPPAKPPAKPGKTPAKKKP